MSARLVAPPPRYHDSSLNSVVLLLGVVIALEVGFIAWALFWRMG